LPLIVLILPLVGLVELAAHLHLRGRAPSMNAYAALSEPVEAMRGAGDLVVASPPWAEPLVLGAVPVGLGEAAPAEDEAYRTAVEVSLFGDRGERLSSWRTLEEQRVGPFTVRRLENPAPRPAGFDFVDGLSPTNAEVHFDDQLCPWTSSAPVVAGGLGGHPAFPAHRFSCGERPWFNVSETVIADERYRPRRCIWAHPPARGELTIRYRGIDLGERLVGHGGMYWIVERERRGSPVSLTISIEGEELARVLHRDGDGWSRFDVPLGPWAGRRDATVTFGVSAPDYRDRHFCFEARVQ
jgi:hypothetical protein